MRKPQDCCSSCRSTRLQCLCDVIPRIDLGTKVSLLIHHRELSRSSNTGLLALRALVNSEVRVRGEPNTSLDLSDLLTRDYQTFLLFPARDAVLLTQDLLRDDPRPVRLIVPDGTWRQTSKVHRRYAELSNLPRVKLATTSEAAFGLRRQHRADGMATLQAIAYALGVLEGNWVKDRLMELYHTKLGRALAGRGLSPESQNFPSTALDLVRS